MVAFDFQVAMHGRDTPPTPLQRGGLGCLFLFGNGNVVWGSFGTEFFLVMSGLYSGNSPLERG